MGSWFDWSFELHPHNDRTILVERLDRSKGLFAAIMLKLLIQRQMADSIPRGLSKIKVKLEASGAQDSLSDATT
jgi:hypothetical protein